MLHEDQRKAREEFSDGKLTGKQFNVGWLPNYLLTYKSFNKAAIEKDKNKFINALVKKGLSLDQATDITNSILENRDSVDFDNEFNVLEEESRFLVTTSAVIFSTIFKESCVDKLTLSIDKVSSGALSSV